jgi:CHAT domain-containing protein/tetratricopeptide (TPR) repeat protein
MQRHDTEHPDPILIDLIPGKLSALVFVHNIESTTGRVSCWSYVTDGLWSMKQRELIFTLRRHPEEGPRDYPEMIFGVFKEVYARAAQGHIVGLEDVLQCGPAGFLGVDDVKALAFIRPQPLKGVVTPRPSLAAILLIGDEWEVAKSFGLTRVTSTLGMAYGYYPFPPWADRSRSSVVSLTAMQAQSVLEQIGHRRWLRSVWVRMEGDKHIILSSLAAARSTIQAVLKDLPPNFPLALMTEPDPLATDCMVWRPGQSQLTLLPTGNNDYNDHTILTANFVAFVPGQNDGQIVYLEDGFALMLADSSWSAIRHALETRSHAVVPITDEVNMSVEHVGSTYEHSEEKWRILNDRVYELRSEKKYAEVIPLAREAVRAAEAAYGPDHLKVAFALTSLSEAYKFNGQNAEAEPLAERALSIRETSLRSNHRAIGESLHVLGNIYDNLGRYTEAEPLYQRSLVILEAHFGREHGNVASLLNDLAGVYAELGRYAEAEPLYRRALAIDEKVLGEEHRNVARDLDNIASLYVDQGKYIEAEPLRRRALAIYEKALGEKHPEVATTLNNLAGLYTREGRYAEAELLYQRAILIVKEAFDEEDPRLATSLSNLASLYGDQGRYAEAEPLIAQALTLHEKALGQEHPLVAIDRSKLAECYVHQGMYSEAEQLFQQALAIREKALGPKHPAIAGSLMSLARLYYVDGKCAEAGVYFDLALQNLQWQFEYHFTYMSEKDRIAFLADHADTYPRYLSYCFSCAAHDPSIARKMFDAMLWMKGLVSNSIAEVRSKVAASGDEEALALFERLLARKGQLANLLYHPKEDLDQWRQTVEQVRQESNDLESNLVRRVSALAERNRLAHVTWQDVQGVLNSDEAAVELAEFPFDDGRQWTDKTYCVALIVKPETRVTPMMVLLGEIKDLLRGPLVWKSLEGALGSTKRIYLSPDGILNLVPIPLMSTGDGRRVLEKHDLRIVSSTKDLLREKSSTNHRAAVLIGNPTFDLEEEQQRAAVAGFSPRGDRSNTVMVAAEHGVRSRDQRGSVLPPLPETGVELEAVRSLLDNHGWHVEMYTEARATEEAIKNVRGPKILHVATHGFFLPDQKETKRKVRSDLPSVLEEPMVRSGLYFAGAQRFLSGHPSAPDLEDGVLTAYEASGLNLQGTELVVLSACETGLGQVANGEGVFGLRRALQGAGAEAVLMSLSSVPDLETRELMSLFYSKWLGGKDKHNALREAQLELQHIVTVRYGSDRPSYWGSFVLVGR